MPNHCSNELRITGPQAELNRFHEGLGPDMGIGIIKAYWPMPEALEGTQSPSPDSPEPHPNWANLLAKGEMTQEWHDELVAKRKEAWERNQQAMAEIGYANWLDWALANWGTKWSEYDLAYLNADSDSPVCDDGSYGYRFSTAWSPCERAIRNISTLFPTLTFQVIYDEPGMCFAGGFIYRNGELLAESYYEDEFPTIVENEDGDLDFDTYNDEMDDLRTMIEAELAEAVGA